MSPPTSESPVTLPVAYDFRTLSTLYPTSPPTPLLPVTSPVAYDRSIKPRLLPTSPPASEPDPMTLLVACEPRTVALRSCNPMSPPTSSDPVTVPLADALRTVPSLYPTSPPTWFEPVMSTSSSSTRSMVPLGPSRPNSPTLPSSERLIRRPETVCPSPSKAPVNACDPFPMGSNPFPSFQSVVFDASMSATSVKFAVRNSSTRWSCSTVAIWYGSAAVPVPPANDSARGSTTAPVSSAPLSATPAVRPPIDPAIGHTTSARTTPTTSTHRRGERSRLIRSRSSARYPDRANVRLQSDARRRTGRSSGRPGVVILIEPNPRGTTSRGATTGRRAAPPPAGVAPSVVACERLRIDLP
jgi:hypothetical protein